MTLTVPTELPGIELVDASRQIKLLIVGYPGSGKTRLCATFCHDERTKPALILDTTGGAAGILDEVHEAGSRVRMCGGMGEVLKYCEWLRANTGQFKTLIVDDFSESFGLEKVDVARRRGRDGVENLEGLDYLPCYERTRRVLRALRVLSSSPPAGAGMHIVVTCWPEREKDKDGGEKIVPLFAGKFGFEVPGYFDVIGFLDASTTPIAQKGKGVVHEFRNSLTVALSDKLLVRDRFHKLDAVTQMPTAMNIMDAWMRPSVSILKGKG